MQEVEMKEIVVIDALLKVSEKVHREVSDNNNTERTRAQDQHNAKTNIQHVNIGIGDYVTVKTYAKCKHK